MMFDVTIFNAATNEFRFVNVLRIIHVRTCTSCELHTTRACTYSDTCAASLRVPQHHVTVGDGGDVTTFVRWMPQDSESNCIESN